ncbi:MAG: ABC transporter ATP-binding protein [Rhodospirillales bacterium]|nr:ABC transporter ATP-binding protein [Rhodospirillales bacterium]
MNPKDERAAGAGTRAAAGVTLENVSISFGANRVVKDVSLKIEPGEFFAFLGPSGSGKSTLLRAIAGFGPPPSGRILIGGEDVTHQPPWTRNVGMVFQSYALWPHMSVRKNVAFGLEERRLPAGQINERVDWALKLVGLAEFGERRPSQLSGGQQQRVALARTIVIQPRVLLLDEPLSNLDAALRVQMRRELRELQRRLGLTTVYVTHDQEEANTVSDRIAVLDNGAIQQVGRPIELYDRPVNRFVAKFLGTANLLDGAIERTGGETVFRSTGGLAVPVAADSPEGGAGCSLLFRPQSLVIAAPDAAAVPGRVRLDGAVEHREFLGSHVRYAVRVNGHDILVDTSHDPGDPGFEKGARVSLYLDRRRTRLLTT